MLYLSTVDTLIFLCLSFYAVILNKTFHLYYNTQGLHNIYNSIVYMNKTYKYSYWMDFYKTQIKPIIEFSRRRDSQGIMLHTVCNNKFVAWTDTNSLWFVKRLIFISFSTNCNLFDEMTIRCKQYNFVSFLFSHSNVTYICEKMATPKGLDNTSG